MDSSYCFTGYRPDKFPFELKLGTKDFISLENKIYDAVFTAVRDGAQTFYCGMAMGFDLLCGKAVADIKKATPNKEIKLIATVPFRKQQDNFTPTWKKLYDIVLSEADEVVIISEEYHKGCFADRNEYMVNKSGNVITYFDGHSGGTANTLRYAVKKGRKIINIAEYDMTDIYTDYSAYQLEI